MGSQKKRPVTLTTAEREELVRVTTTGVHPASMIRRAQVLLALDTSAGEADPKEVIATRLGVSGETLRLVARRFAETGGDIRATITGLSSAARMAPPWIAGRCAGSWARSPGKPDWGSSGLHASCAIHSCPS